MDDEHTWHLDEEQVQEQVRTCLCQGDYLTAYSQLASMFAKVKNGVHCDVLNVILCACWTLICLCVFFCVGLCVFLYVLVSVYSSMCWSLCILSCW